MHPIKLILAVGSCSLQILQISASASGASQPKRSPLQVSPGDNNLPPERYRELRLEALAHARLLTGPRLKNPRLGSGLDLEDSSMLAAQRTHLRAGSPVQTNVGLLSGQTSTLLPTAHAGAAPQLKSHTSVLNRQLIRDHCEFPVIRSVNGRQTAPAFTPVEPDNHYRIEGCGFGTVPGQVNLLASRANSSAGQRPEPVLLTLDGLKSWTDDRIDVHIDPDLTGKPDFSADLVIQLADGRRVQLSGCRFIAPRGEPQLLRSIPAAWVRLDSTSVPGRSIGQLEFESPPVQSEQVPPEAVGTSAFIARSDPGPFGEGKDFWDFSQLAPGWTVESVQLQVFASSCPGDSILAASTGSWTTTWTAHGFVVAWAGDTCSSFVPPVFHFALSSSQYATKVWVIGPLGTQPFNSSRR